MIAGATRRGGQALARRLDPEARYGLRLTLFAAAFVLVGVPFSLLVVQVSAGGALVRLDAAMARGLNSWVVGSPWVVTPLEVVSFLGSPVWFWLVVPPATVVAWRRHHRLGVFLAVTVLAGGVLNSAVKLAVGRARPSLPDPVATARGLSFPSGHATSSTVVYGALLLVFLPLVGRRLRPLVVAGAVALVGAIGFTRLALGVHYLSDVVGGVILGAAWLAASVAAFSAWRVDLGRGPVNASEGLEPEPGDG